MEHFKGTPGPWRVGSGKHSILANYPGREFPKMVASAYVTNDPSPTFKDREELAANARLIAAAPDMIDAMASAIKALGELNPHCIPTSYYETPTEQHQRECVTDAYHTLLAAYNLAIKGW